MKKLVHSFLGLLLTLTLFVSVAAAASDFITGDAAAQAALSHAQVLDKDAILLRVKLEKDQGKYEYDITFYSNGVEYEYEIDAVTGSVTSFESEAEKGVLPLTDAGVLLSVQDATAAALAHAKVDGTTAALNLAQLEYDDGRWTYEVTFSVGATVYEYDVDATTGGIVSFEQDMNGTALEPSGAISPEEAKAIALAHAGLSAQNVRELKVERDQDHTPPTYDVEFKANGKEYSYDIDVKTGDILKQETEADD